MSLLQRIFGDSPETTLGGLGAGIGLILTVIGLVFGKDSVWQMGMAIVAAAASYIGLAARSQSQHEKDRPEVKAEVKREVTAEVKQEVKQEVAEKVEQIVGSTLEQKRPS